MKGCFFDTTPIIISSPDSVPTKTTNKREILDHIFGAL